MPRHPTLERAFWETAGRGVLVFSHDYRTGTLPEVYWGPTGVLLSDIAQVPAKMVGEWQAYYVEGGEVVFTLLPADYPYVGWGQEAIYLAGPFNQWNPVGSSEWAFQEIKASGHKRWELRIPLDWVISGGSSAPFPFKAVTATGIWLSPPPRVFNREQDATGNVNWVFHPQRTGRQVFYFNAPAEHRFLAPAFVEHQASSREMEVDYVLLSIGSEEAMGARVEGNRTIFRLFAPRAEVVKVHYQKNPTEEYVLALKAKTGGIWEGEVPQNLHGYHYAYTLDGAQDASVVFDPSMRLIDPYAEAIVGEAGPGIIIDTARVDKPTACYCPPAWHDLVVMEAHVRDLVAKAPMELSDSQRQGFTGLTRWLREPDCYFKQLGINAVELQPVQAFDGNQVDYHWGYMTVNYFSPAPAYALNPEEGSQIGEFQALVKAFHDAHIAVIIDVVYNHVGNPNSFYHIDKQYYMRTDKTGAMENWSGCGNDLRTETPMARRLIIDSLIHWVERYDVDGFRFDLADLVGVGVLEEVEKALKAVKPGIILIAEPWSFRGHAGEALKHTGWSSWNDGYRECIAQYVLGAGNTAGLTYFMQGSTAHLARFPAQTVNYVESHDDRTWIDKITENPEHNGMQPTLHDIRRTHLMVAILMASLGIPMLSAGQEFLRSKGGISNTYQRGDINALDYDRAEDNPGTEAYFRHWITLRQSDIGRTYFKHEQTPRAGYFHSFSQEGHTAMGLLYNANGSVGRKRLLFVVNPHTHAVDLFLPGLDPHFYKQLADHERVDVNGIEPPFMRWEKGYIHLPALSCGLFEGS